MDSIRAGLVTAAALLLLPLGATNAAAQDVECGKVVTENITLENDVLDCPAGTNGLTIGADGITVNLNGHKISGRPGATGIDNSDGHNDVRIIGEAGSISGFTNGIEFRGAGRMRVSSLTLQDNAQNGLRVLDSRDGRFSDLQVIGNGGDGAVFGEGADRNEIRKTFFTRNKATGLVVVGAENTVAGNWANNNGGNGFTIRSTDTTVKANVADANEKQGIDAVDGTSDAGGNRASGNAGGPQCTGVAC